MKRIISILFAVLLSGSTFASAQTTESEKPYKLQRAIEVLEQDNNEELALSLLKEQLSVTTDNAECWLVMTMIYRDNEEYGTALSCVNKAIKVNEPSVSGIFNSSLYWWKATIYNRMGLYEQESECLSKALSYAQKDNESQVQRISFDLAQSFYRQGMYEESDAIYWQIIKEDESNQAAMVYIARSMMDRGLFEPAVEVLTICQKYGEGYAPVYNYRCRAFYNLGEIDKAIDDALIYYELDDDPSISVVTKLIMKHYNYGLAGAKKMMEISEEPSSWSILIANLYEESGNYDLAIKEYNQLEAEYGAGEFLLLHRADCYDSYGLFDKALEDINKAIEMSDDYANNCMKGDILRDAGRYSEAIESYNRAIQHNPTTAFAYYGKGWCHELSGNDNKAMECYELGIDMDKSYPYIYLMRGEMYLKRGEISKANADFEQVLQMDTTARDGSCRHYALHFLDRDEEAMEWMEQIIENCPNDAGNWYDKSCLLCRMGKTDEAVEALRTSLENGYSQFAHINHDDDIDPIRDREDFKLLMNKYKAQLARKLVMLDRKKPVNKEEKVTEVPISKHYGGTFDVNCEVNGLSLCMLFDTGASDVTISKVEADFMLKNRYLSPSDIKGTKYYQIADGGLTEGTVIILREVKIGDVVLHDIEASVVKSQRAPLLLGESVLQKFGTFTVDNINNKLIIVH